MKNFIVAITGASGAAYAMRVIQLLLLNESARLHLVISPLGRRLLADELGMTRLPTDITGDPRVQLHEYNDLGSPLASGSFIHDGMSIVPCSNNTLAQVAHGLSGNLIARAASVALKERRKLILCHRETPLSLAEIRNYQLATEAGAIIAPANPGFYMNPTSIDEIVDFMAGKILDLLGMSHHLNTRWKPDLKNPRGTT